MTQSVVAQTTGIIGIAYDWRTEANRTKGSDFDLFLDKSLLGKATSSLLEGQRLPRTD